jgi:serine/threonine protein kinase
MMSMKTLVGKSLQKGKYIIDQELGEGGFGITYKAINQSLDRVVVIKTLKLSSSQSENLTELRDKFLEEARSLVKCSHPNIVRFQEFFIENGLPYIVMDYIPGKTLDEIVIPNNPLPEETAINYIRQLGEALKVVHQNGLLHRDVKPQNIILHEDTQEVVLIDFGIAREFFPGAVQTHTSLTSAGYAPIEQYLRQSKRTPATDVYGLAATLYTLLTAEVPVLATLRDHLPFPSPREIRPELSEMVSNAVMQGMALQPEERPSSIDEWLYLFPGNKNHARSIIQRPLVLSGSKSNKYPQILAGLAMFSALAFGLSSAWLKWPNSLKKNNPNSPSLQIPLNSSENIIKELDQLKIETTPSPVLSQTVLPSTTELVKPEETNKQQKSPSPTPQKPTVPTKNTASVSTKKSSFSGGTKSTSSSVFKYSSSTPKKQRIQPVQPKSTYKPPQVQTGGDDDDHDDDD